MLKPQDILVSLKAHVYPGHWTYQDLADELEMSTSEVHAALKRAANAGLYNLHRRALLPEPFLEMLGGGLRYFLSARPGRLVRGIPTAHSGPPLNAQLLSEEEDVYVWPDPEGKQRGQAIEPLYRSVPLAARKDAALYEWLNLLEAIRVGRPRERKMALEECKKRLAVE